MVLRTSSDSNETLARNESPPLRRREAGANDLALETHDVFTVAKLAGGYTRYFAPMRGLNPGVGAGASIGIVPASLETVYGRRTNAGVSVYLTVRPGARGM